MAQDGAEMGQDGANLAHVGARSAHVGARSAHLGAGLAHLDARFVHLAARLAQDALGVSELWVISCTAEDHNLNPLESTPNTHLRQPSWLHLNLSSAILARFLFCAWDAWV